MKVLLIDPSGWQKHSLNLGLAYLAGALRSADIEVQIFDLNNNSYSEEYLIRNIAAYKPQVVGISVKTATVKASIEILKVLKRHFPSIIYVAGGPHITLCGKDFMNKNTEIDFGVAGEGEVSFIELVKSLKNDKRDFSKIQGIYYRRNQEIFFNNRHESLDLSKLSFPSFEHIRNMDFTDFRYPLLTSRGCPYGCIFCCVGLISGKKWRGREPEDVVNELLEAKEKYQIASFEIMDDNFTFDIDRAKEICRIIIKKKLNLDWWCHNGLRADKLDQELLNLMKRAGCKSIALGIESGDESVFNNINKGEKLSDIIKAVKMIKKSGIKCVGYFIVGLPGETVGATKKTVRLQRELKLADYKYNMLIPYPGTRIWQIVQERGRMLTNIEDSYHFGDDIKIPFETDEISKKTIEKCYYLANNQNWVYGEECLENIDTAFRARFQKDIKRIAVITNDSINISRDLEIKFEKAHVIQINLKSVSGDIKGKYLLKESDGFSYFDSLFDVTQTGYKLIADISKRGIFLQKDSKGEEEYIRGEILPEASQWDNSARKYFATRLKYHSSDNRSPKNGIIYKDNITLPFSPAPQWEKIPCGKIESGIAFISISAFDPKSSYTADYLTIKAKSELRELITLDTKDSLFERIISESDILFCPDALEYFALLVSRPKMNVFYYTNGHGPSSLEYRISEPFLLKRNYYVIRKMKQIVLNTRQRALDFVVQFLSVMRKCSKVLILWTQILFFMALKKIKDFISKIIRF